MNHTFDTWERLSRTTQLRFVAQSGHRSGWNGSGEGSVVVASPSSGTLTFAENGRWQPTGGPWLDFRNVFRWSWGASGAIALEHLRFGVDNPVHLFEMHQENAHTWASTAPHVCRDDLYSATMTLTAHHIELRWTIQGPRKNEDIRYWYS